MRQQQEHHGLTILHKTVFLGPNVARLGACVRVVVAADIPCDSRLSEPAIGKAEEILRAMPGEDGGTALPVARRTPAGIFLEAALRLQRVHRYPVSWGQVLPLAGGVCEIAFEIARPSVAGVVAEYALLLARAALGMERRETFGEECRRFHDLLFPRARHLYRFDRQRTASRMGVYCQTGFGMHTAYMQMGQGAHARIVTPSYTVATSHLGKDLAGDKNQTHFHLLRHQLPAARQAAADSEDEAVAAAKRLGYPVVVKPLRGYKGRGVSVNLRDEGEVRAAYRLAGRIQSSVVVERYLHGDDYRLLVVGGKFTAAVKRPPPSVTGDGIHTVSRLIALANKTEQRDGLIFEPITVDEEALRVLSGQGVGLDTVPPSGRQVLIRRSASPESTTVDVTDEVHPDNRALAVAAAQACFLDVAGIDFISPGIGQSWKENGGGIVEVNAGPSIDLHMYPKEGRRRDISWHMIRSCLPARAPGRIPLVMVTGTYDKKATAGWIVNLLALLGYRTGEPAREEGGAGLLPFEGESAARVAGMLSDPRVDAGVFGISLRTLADEGAPVDRASVTVITDGHALRHEEAGAEWESSMNGRIHRLAVDIASSAVVIDGTLPALREAAAHRPPWQTGYVWQGEADTAPLEAHLAAGGWAVVCEADEAGEKWLACRRGTSRQPIARLRDLFAGASAEADAAAPPKGALTACAVALGMGLRAELLAAPLQAAWRAAGQRSTLRLDGARMPGIAACDPRQEIALERLAAWCRATPCRKLRLAVAAECETLSWLGAALRELEPLSPDWCCAGRERQAAAAMLRRLGVAEERIMLFGDVSAAWEALCLRGEDGDLAALLDADESVRNALFKADFSSPERLAQGEAPWSATELAELFDGAWVNGPASGWGVDLVVSGHEGAEAGCLAVVAGTPDDPDGVEKLENEIRYAFARGARAVAAPLVPPDLPRWHPVLVCDNAALGLERLAQASRRRSAGAPIVRSVESRAGAHE